MTAARDDDSIALPGMEADSTDTHHGRERLSDDTAPTSANTSSKSALDALLDEYRACAKSEREKGALFEELTRQFLLHDARFAHQFKEISTCGASGRRTAQVIRASTWWRSRSTPPQAQSRFSASSTRWVTAFRRRTLTRSSRRRPRSLSAAASTPASASDPPSNTNDTKRPRQQPHKQTVNNLRTGAR